MCPFGHWGPTALSGHKYRAEKNKHHGRWSLWGIVMWYVSHFSDIPENYTRRRNSLWRSYISSKLCQQLCASDSHTSEHFQLWGAALVNPFTGMQLAEQQLERSFAPLSLQKRTSMGVSTSTRTEGFWEDHNRAPGGFPFTASWYPRSGPAAPHSAGEISQTQVSIGHQVSIVRRRLCLNVSVEVQWIMR